MAEFEWTTHPGAEAFIEDLVANAMAQSPRLAELDRMLQLSTSTRLMNWLDYIGGPLSGDALEECGFVEGHLTRAGIWRHPGAQLPAVVPGARYVVGLRVDDVVAFAHANGTSGIEGSSRSGFRRAVVSGDEEVVIAGVERRSWMRGIEPQVFTDREMLASLKAWQLWDERDRPNTYRNSAEVVAAVIPLAEQMVSLVGEDLAASYVLELERQYWQRRNTAGMLQFARQDRLGMGWGNNDHHTFRSSREAFKPLVQMFNTLGFLSRERFYAGDQAGWGAQVLEHPGCGGVLFTDVDLTPEEVGIDFSDTELPASAQLGTVGMWCALHGESILAPGMHHLEGQFEFEQLRDDLEHLGVRQMKPFSTFPHLQQAFTEAERWPVSDERIDALLADGIIDKTQAAEFRDRGAAGSHLENLQRRGGFKGFNQHSVSTTMQATDPRSYQPVAATQS